MTGLDSALISLLSSAGVAGVFCVLFVLGLIYPRSVVSDKDAEIADLKAAVRYERDRADSAVTALSATNSILAAIQYGRNAGIPAGNDP